METSAGLLVANEEPCDLVDSSHVGLLVANEEPRQLVDSSHVGLLVANEEPCQLVDSSHVGLLVANEEPCQLVDAEAKDDGVEEVLALLSTTVLVLQAAHVCDELAELTSDEHQLVPLPPLLSPRQQ